MRINPWAAALLAGLIAVSAHAELRKFDMTIEEVELEIAPGFKSKVWAFNGQVPGPLIHVKEGDDLEVHVQNNTTLNHTIHWHGQYQLNTWQSDGVPDITQKAIEPGESFTYKFKALKSGSLWYHCHVNVPEHVGIRGMWGPIIIEPKEKTALEKTVTKDAILMFSGWNPEVADTYGEGGHPNEPISYFSINGKSMPMTQPLRVKKGDVLRLRLMAATIPVAFHPHGHDAIVTHKDGLPLEHPYPVDVLAMAPGERYDVILEMNNPGLWISHDHYEHHVSNNGKEPGGAIFIIEYEEIEKPDWYVWKNKEYQPDFYFSESLAKPYGIHDVDAHRGIEPADERRRRRR
ncbi:MAG TPA: multicopper oxidase domain-containing protein [Spongiibacteraceae bacterium]|jgi:FtsP/CotA-like multicopper oxidase with cupredoxin domain|nr:multicopper oxidase domain-containing protein [Spongiibacteraceae bacterium]HUH38683.1 multicopper oxidase domain-containing protein [Spongiibacteraceae bacterium]